MKKNDTTAHKKTADDLREKSVQENQNTVLTPGGSISAADCTLGVSLPAIDQAQVAMQFKGLSDRPEPLRANNKIVQRKNNGTGLPDRLKHGIENLSGYSMDDVKVHYNSSRPAQLQAHAFAQGTDIHLASGQEKHLPHEAWHVVQQKQGRVKPTIQLKGKVGVNNDERLEREADVMGEQSLRANPFTKNRQAVRYRQANAMSHNQAPVQRLMSNKQLGDKVAKGLFTRRSRAYRAIRKDYRLWHKRVKNEHPAVQLGFLEMLLNKLKRYIAFNKGKKVSPARTAKIKAFEEVKDEVQVELRVIGDYDGSVKPDLAPIDFAGNLDELNPERDEVDDRKWKEGGEMNMDITRVNMNEEGSKGIFKPEIKKDAHYGHTRGKAAGIPKLRPNQTGRSIAAYRIDQLLTAGTIPATYRADRGEKAGSVMKMIENGKSAAPDIEDFLAPVKIKNKHMKELSNLYLMDVITGQVDRHLGNILLKKNKVWGIDNDMAFGCNVNFDEKKGKVSVPAAGTQPKDFFIDKEFAIKIIELSRHPAWVEEALADLLSEAEIQKTIERLKSLAAYLIRRIAENKKIKNAGDWT